MYDSGSSWAVLGNFIWNKNKITGTSYFESVIGFKFTFIFLISARIMIIYLYLDDIKF